MSNSRLAYLSIKQKLAYGTGSLGTSTFFVVPQLLLLFFMTEVLSVPAGYAAIAMFVPKIWECVTDPIIGGWSDGLESRWGRRLPVMAIGAFIFSITFAAMFYAPQFTEWQSNFVYVLVMFAICTTAYTLFSVPYIAMPSEMTENYHERTSIVSYRMVFVSIGVLLSGALAPTIIDFYDDAREGYSKMGFVFAAIAFFAMFTAILGTRTAPATKKTDVQHNLAKQIQLGLSNRPFLILWSVFIFQMVGISMQTVVLPYFTKYWLNDDGSVVTQFFIYLTLATLLSMPIWVKISANWGKRNAFLLSTSVQVIGCVLVAFTPQEEISFFLLTSLVIGAGNAGVQLFPFAILPDIIDLDRSKSGMNREGAFTGVWVAGEKLGLALGAAFTGFILSTFGFQETSQEAVFQPAEAVTAIRMMMSLVPAILLFLTLFLLLKYKENKVQTNHYQQTTQYGIENE